MVPPIEHPFCFGGQTPFVSEELSTENEHPTKLHSAPLTPMTPILRAHTQNRRMLDCPTLQSFFPSRNVSSNCPDHRHEIALRGPRKPRATWRAARYRSSSSGFDDRIVLLQDVDEGVHVL